MVDSSSRGGFQLGEKAGAHLSSVRFDSFYINALLVASIETTDRLRRGETPATKSCLYLSDAGWFRFFFIFRAGKTRWHIVRKECSERGRSNSRTSSKKEDG